MNARDNEQIRVAGCGALMVAAGVLSVVLLLAGIIAGFKAFGRWQSVQDANNSAHVARIKAANEQQVNRLRISAQQQMVKIAQQQAQIRFENSKGVREAQDEIAKTLTPLYVQFEMTQALKDIAQSGKNTTVIYIPVGPDGRPVVAPVAPAGGGK
jgi:uncharacterized protein HemX